MIVEHRSADPAIRAVVRSYSERRATLGATIVSAPLPARPDQFIEIYLRDRYRVSHDDAPPALAPEMVVVGPQSYRSTRLVLSGDIHVFTIGFQPGGFHALFDVPMDALVDQGAVARDVMGPAAAALRVAVLAADDFAGRAAAATRWIADRLAPVDPVGRMAALLARSGGRVRIDAMARRAGLSDRQFTRRFAHQVGLPPKLYARTVRFNAVLSAKARTPAASWTGLAHDAGYADQAHFVRDCRAFADAAPSVFYPDWIQGR